MRSFDTACGADYIGSTCRHLIARIGEHQDDHINGHMTLCQVNNINLEACFGVIHNNIKSYRRMLIFEALYIKRYKPILNTQHMSEHRNQYILKVI